MKFLLILWALLGINHLSAKQDSTVLICKSAGAEVYHSHYCWGLNNCKHPILKVTLQEAIRMGRRACQICYSGRAPSKPDNPPGDGRCRAITKKGTRCSRSAGSNGYCWQHGG